MSGWYAEPESGAATNNGYLIECGQFSAGNWAQRSYDGTNNIHATISACTANVYYIASVWANTLEAFGTINYNSVATTAGAAQRYTSATVSLGFFTSGWYQDTWVRIRTVPPLNTQPTITFGATIVSTHHQHQSHIKQWDNRPRSVYLIHGRSNKRESIILI